MNSYMFVNGVEIYKFKAKDCGRNVAPSCLSNVSKEFFSWWHQKSSIDANDVDDSLDIHKHLMKKHNIKQCLDSLKKCLLHYQAFVQ